MNSLLSIECSPMQSIVCGVSTLIVRMHMIHGTPDRDVPSIAARDLSNTVLSGSVLDNGSFSLFTPISFANNLNQCGQVIGRTWPGSPQFSPPPPFVPPPPISIPVKPIHAVPEFVAHL